MPDSPISQPESDFVCECDERNGSACVGQPFYREDEGKRYCVLHFPGKEKSADFAKALQSKLGNKDFNFAGVWFPLAVDFKEFHFSEDADFYFATFNFPANFSFARFSASAIFQGAKFHEEANFSSATFNGDVNFAFTRFHRDASFTAATFLNNAFFLGTKFVAAAYFYAVKFEANAYFVSASFGSDANFTDCHFTGEVNFKRAAFNARASFWDAKFKNKTGFCEATFLKEADFREAIFSDYLELTGTHNNNAFSDESSLDLQFARFERPDRVLFHTLTLHAHWFINVDARRFDFINIYWGNYGNAKRELELLNGVPSRHRLLVITCRNLAANAEENGRFRSASQFRLMAMDTERLESWRGFDFRKLNWWYWLASGYGERVFRAFLVLLGIWLVAGFLYTQVGFARWEPRIVNEADAVTTRRDDHGAPLPPNRAITYSLAVMTLQRPEPKPATTAAQTVVLLETILGPVQAALLALAIRRKFMR